MLASLRTKFLLPTFYVFFQSHFKKNVKSHVFLKSEKTKNTYSRTLLARAGYFNVPVCYFVKRRLRAISSQSLRAMHISAN